MINAEQELSLARFDMGLVAIIGKTDRDANGRKIDTRMHTTVRRLRTWDSRTHIHTSAERSIIQAFNELDILKDKYSSRKARYKGLSRGRATSGLMAAAIYAACRKMGTPRTLK
jgi:transcription initiation factor TFIIB